MSKPPDASTAAASLFLSPEAPFPAIGGGALRSASLLEYLGRTSGVDRILFRQPGQEDPSLAIPAGITGRSWVVDLPYHRKDVVSKIFRNALRAMRGAPALMDRFAGFELRLAGFLEGRGYGLGVIEHFWCAPYLEQLRSHCDQLWLDLHNIESVLQERQGEVVNPVSRAGYRRFAGIYRHLERELIPRFDRILVTSESDADLIREIAPSSQIVIFPNTLPERMRPLRVEEDCIVFSGNMAYPPNTDAVRYFASAVWPILRKQWPDLVWRLVGKNPEAVSRYVRAENYIQLRGPVQDAVSELARAKVAIVPVRAGSGTRVKILEAWAAATPIVSTSLGAEGLPVRDGEHLLIADDAGCFAETVSRLLKSPSRRADVGESGRRLYEEQFTWAAGWKVLDRALGIEPQN